MTVKKPSRVFWATCVCVMIRAAASHAATTEIVLYSGDAATLSGHWTRATDPTAAGGQLLTTPDAGWDSTSTPLAAPVNYVEWTFDADANTNYRIWLRLRATANSKWNDSLYVQFSIHSMPPALRSTVSGRRARCWSTSRVATLVSSPDGDG